MKVDVKQFKPYMDEGLAALKDAGKKLGKTADKFLEQHKRLQNNADALLAAMEGATPEQQAQLANALATLIEDRKVFILAAVEAELGTQGKAVLEAALDIGGRLLAAAVKHFLL